MTHSHDHTNVVLVQCTVFRPEALEPHWRYALVIDHTTTFCVLLSALLDVLNWFIMSLSLSLNRWQTQLSLPSVDYSCNTSGVYCHTEYDPRICLSCSVFFFSPTSLKQSTPIVPFLWNVAFSIAKCNIMYFNHKRDHSFWVVHIFLTKNEINTSY